MFSPLFFLINPKNGDRAKKGVLSPAVGIKGADMLEEYLKAYLDAYKKGDEKAMRQIERDLSLLGMDKATLQILAKEEMNA